MEQREKKLNSNPSALLPILIFLVLYLGMGLIFEYGIGINMAFYDIPIVVTFMVALLVACLQNKKLSFDEKLVLMGRGVGDKNIITMILIFLVAGVFVGVTGRNSAEAVAYFLLSIAPAWASVAGSVRRRLLCVHRYGHLYRHHHPDHPIAVASIPGVPGSPCPCV